MSIRKRIIIVFRVCTLHWTCNSFSAQQASENIEPEVPGRSIQERKVSALFSDTVPQLFATRKREATT